MKLKGNFSAAASYNVGDIVVDGGVAYYKYQSGEVKSTSPVDTHEWKLLHQPLADAVLLMMDAIGIAGDNAKTEVEKYFINDQTLILKAGEGEDEKSYAVTVDATGDTPELAVEEVTEGGD